MVTPVKGKKEYSILFIALLLITQKIIFSSSEALGAREDYITPDSTAFFEKHRESFEPFDLKKTPETTLKLILSLLLESPQYQKLAAESPKDLIHTVQVMLNSYRLSDPLKEDILALASFQLKKEFQKDTSLDFEEISRLNLEILERSLLKVGPLTPEEISFFKFLTRESFYLMKPSFIDPDEYRNDLLVSYDLFAYPALREYSDYLKLNESQNPKKSVYFNVWSSPTCSTGLDLIKELDQYILKINPLSETFYQGLPIKRSGYNASVDAPIYENGQFVFFRLTPDHKYYSSSHMGTQYLSFRDQYLDALAVAYLSDHIDPIITHGVEIPLADGQFLSRITRITSSEELQGFDPDHQLSTLHHTTAFYTVCYSPSELPCAIHNTANEIFFGPDIKTAIAWRLIFEIRQIKLAHPHLDYPSKILEKRHMDEELYHFITQTLHVQALFPGIYPIHTPRFLGVLAPLNSKK